MHNQTLSGRRWVMSQSYCPFVCSLSNSNLHFLPQRWKGVKILWCVGVQGLRYPFNPLEHGWPIYGCKHSFSEYWVFFRLLFRILIHTYGLKTRTQSLDIWLHFCPCPYLCHVIFLFLSVPVLSCPRRLPFRCFYMCPCPCHCPFSDQSY